MSVFEDCVICASGTLSMKKNEFSDLVKENGGKYSDNFTNSVISKKKKKKEEERK